MYNARVAKVLPDPFLSAPMRALPIVLVFLAMFYWLWRVRGRVSVRRQAAIRTLTRPALVRLAGPLVLSPFVRHNLRRYLSKPNHADLAALKKLLESGAIRPVIDQTFPLQETPRALRYIESGHTRGKVVITVT